MLLRLLFSSLVSLTLAQAAQADVITFTHTDNSTNYATLPGGSTGHTLELSFQDSNTGIANRVGGSGNFVSATFASGSYTATYTSLSGTMATNALGDITTSQLFGITGGTDTAGGGTEARLDIVSLFTGAYLLTASNSATAGTSQTSWSSFSTNVGWSVSAAAAVPEPNSLTLAGLVSMGLIGYRRRKN